MWNDLDHDAVEDPHEPPLAGALIIVYDETGMEEIARQTTQGDGYARFDLPAPDAYTVVMQPPWGMRASTSTEYSVIINVDVEILAPFGAYDIFQKVYLPHILHPAP